MRYLLILLLPFSILYSQSSLELRNQTSALSFNSGIETRLMNPVQPAGTDLQKKKPIIGILFSFLLPGMGEYYAGDYTTGKYFTIAEAAFWGTYMGMSYYSSYLKDNYITYSTTNAGASTVGKDDDYYANIGNYRDIYQYNDEMAFQRRFEKMYNEDTHYWKWNSVSERKAYRTMWVSSQQTKNNLRFVAGAMLLNRIASAINAARLVVKYNKGLEETSLSIVTVDYSFLTQSINLNFYTNI